jgi:Protein of unknown function, DUF481
MCRKTFAFFLLSLFFQVKLPAQLNEGDTAKFQIRASMTGNFQKGNVELTLVRGRLEAVYAPVENWVLKTQNSSMYQAFFSKKADNDVFSRNYLYFKPFNRIYPFALAFVSTNFRRKIDLRYFIGPGVTYRVVWNKKHSVKAAAGVVYEQTRFAASNFNANRYDGTGRIGLWRATVWTGGSHRLAGDRIRFFSEAFYQPAFDTRENFRWQLDTGLDFPVWKGFSFNVLYTVTNENITIEKIKQRDRVLSFGAAYNFRKK